MLKGEQVEPAVVPRAVRPDARSLEPALTAALAVSSDLDSDEQPPEFIGRLSETIAGQTGARRAAFWRLGPRGALALQPAPYGFDDSSGIAHALVQPGGRGDGLIERIVFGDALEVSRTASHDLDEVWRAAGLRGVESSLAATWRAGDLRFGMVAVYDSAHGFTAQDVWVLRLAGLVAGLVWQYKESEDELSRLLAAGSGEARRRLASAQLDDALQLLTGAELQLERVRLSAKGDHDSVHLEQLRATLSMVEDSLRRVLT